jgi:phage gp46-like protein
MTFADQYADHAFADLIREAETQGIEIGASQERERIIAILERDADEWYRLGNKHTRNAIKLAIWLIKGESH